MRINLQAFSFRSIVFCYISTSVTLLYRVFARLLEFCWRCPHSMRSRVYVTARCPSVSLFVRPSVPFARCNSVRLVCCCGSGKNRKYRLIAARPAPRQHEVAARRSAANAGSATFTADLGSWTQTCMFNFRTVFFIMAIRLVLGHL